MTAPVGSPVGTPTSYAEWLDAYGVTPERDAEFMTLSGEAIRPLYTEADLPDACADRPARRLSLHARGLPLDVPRPAVDDAPVRRLRHRRGDQRALPLPARARPDRALDRVRHAVADGPRLRLAAVRRARSAARAWRSTRSRTCATLFAGIDLGEVSVSMTINAPAAIMLAFYVVAAEGSGVPADRLGRDDPGGHPQGVHRPEGVVLPDRPGDAAARRHDRVVLGATCRAGIRSRSPATTSARPARPPPRSSRSR